MKEWNRPQIKELNVSNTEHMAFSGTTHDGNWTSDQTGKTYETYSGPFTGTPED